MRPPRSWRQGGGGKRGKKKKKVLCNQWAWLITMGLNKGSMATSLHFPKQDSLPSIRRCDTATSPSPPLPTWLGRSIYSWRPMFGAAAALNVAPRRDVPVGANLLTLLISGMYWMHRTAFSSVCPSSIDGVEMFSWCLMATAGSQPGCMCGRKKLETCSVLL